MGHGWDRSGTGLGHVDVEISTSGKIRPIRPTFWEFYKLFHKKVVCIP